MKKLLIRNVPDDLYEKLHTLAHVKNRSLREQIIVMLVQAVEGENRREAQAKLLTSIQGRRFKAPENAPSSLELLREDRGR
jgi:plasmid stability protein